MIPVSKSFFLAKYPGANELRIPGGSKKESEKKQNKKTRVMLSMKNWHGNWLKSVLDVLDMLSFCIMTLCGILFSLRATKFHSPLA